MNHASSNPVSLFRLYLLRAMYLLVAVGLGAVVVWPALTRHGKPWELMEGVVQCMLVAFWAMSLLGLRYPLRMLPVLFWELAWKSVWLIVVAVPLWSAGQMDESTWQMAASILMVVVIPFVIPWRYVFTHYVRTPAEQWR